MQNYNAWAIKESDFPQSEDILDQLNFLCRYATLAPSLHNIQPWSFDVSYATIKVSLDRNRMLEHGDPLERESMISIGAAIENIIISAAHFGLAIAVNYEEAENGTVTLRASRVKPNKSGLLSAIVSRVSDRNVYDGRELQKTVIKELECESDDNILVKVITDKEDIRKISEFTSKAISLAMTSPDFKKELTSIMHNNLTKSYSGMPGFTMGWGLFRSFCQPLLIRFVSSPTVQARREFDMMNSSSGIALFFSKGDTRKDWLLAGMKYQLIGTKVASYGVHQSTSAALVEALDFHDDIEEMAGTKYRLQTVLRLGYSNSSPKHSPRYESI